MNEIMRKSTAVIIALIVISIIITIVFMILLPENVPIKYDMSGTVLKTGSKFSHLVFPLSVLLCGGITAACCENSVTAGEKEKRIAGIICIIILLGIITVNTFIMFREYSLF